MRIVSVSPAPPALTRPDNECELALLRRVKHGDRVAFEALYGAYYHRLGRFLGRLIHRQDLIEEVINDVFWVVWQKAA